jgi:Right handed beta helix region
VTIADNIIEDNWAMQGAGVYVENARATVERNHIRNNLRPGNFGGSSGTGVHVTGIQATARIVNNIIEGNRIQGQADGGAVSLFHTAHPIVIESNIIRNNTGATLGGGFAMVSQTEGRVRFANNLVTGNSALRGGGVYLAMVQAGAGIDLLNNTLADNVASETGSELATFGFAESVFAANNIIAGSGAAPAVWCDSIYSPLSPVFAFNVMFGTLGAAALGNCSQAPYLSSNLNADPRFGGYRNRNRYELGPGSPAIDRGDNTWASGLATDVSGRPRRVDANHDGKAVVDIGALEVQGQRQ